jgi:NAD(P)-dependent dehydrogenase (short-subunit alcohol dehydrogenase family)
MALPLEGQVAFITGAASGLGAAFARRLAKDGAIIIVNDMNADAADRLATELGGNTAIFDVTDSTAFDTAVDEAVKNHGRLDILINNAGIAPPDSGSKWDAMMANEMKRMEGDISGMNAMNHLVDLSDANWDRMIKVHLYGTFYGCRAALRHMQPQRAGKIVNIASVLGLYPNPAAPDYSVAKMGIIGLTKSVAYEVAHLGIRVNAVCPGYVDTPLLTPLSEAMKAAITTQIPIGRMAKAEELAEMVRFLVGPESSYCTGEVISVSGGYH